MDARERKLLTADEAAEVLALTARQVTIRAAKGELASVRLPGGEVRFILDDLWSWVDLHRRPAEVER